MRRATVFLIKIYQYTLSPILRIFLGQGCRFQPTCSRYAVDIIQKYGIFRGGRLVLRRLSKCHP